MEIERSYPDGKDLERTISTLKGAMERDRELWAVLDGYHFDDDFQRAIRETGVRTLVIDDHHHLPRYTADIILNQNIGAESTPYPCESDTVMLLGTSYALLRNEFLSQEPGDRALNRAARRVLVSLGGADLDNVTLKVVQALGQLKSLHLEVTIVLGPVNSNRKIIQSELENHSLEYQVLSGVDDMSPLLRWADLAVSAGGSSCWELAFMGVPFLVIVLAKNQEAIARGLGEANAATDCGWFHQLSVRRLAGELKRIILDDRRRETQSKRGRQLVDGLGRERVLDKMETI
jgi:UDP-2,4-diacetamido-2,4,6-trideoxy-beta-L-altropyranose hydrolase